MTKIIAIIGSGIVGKSLAQLYATNGFTVHLYDSFPQQIENCIHSIMENCADSDDTCDSDAITNRIKPFCTLKEAIKGAFLIQECVPEKFEMKREVFQQIDSLMTPQQILSSSTSTILASKLSEGLNHQNRFIVCHPVNPINIIPIVEVIPAPWTDEDVTKTMQTLLIKCGKEPIVLKKEISGFIVNRLQYAILNECYSLVKQGIASVEDIDRVMSNGLCIRWAFLGPFQTACLNANSWDDYCEKYADVIKDVSDTFEPPPLYGGKISENISQELKSLMPLDRMKYCRNKLADNMVQLLKFKKEKKLK